MKKTIDEIRREVIEAAVEYARREWSVIPLKDDKKPIERWKARMVKRLSPEEARALFERHARDGILAGVGVVCGKVSGGLFVRDFDKKGSYDAWKKEHPNLATTLPTVETERGFHVYAVSHAMTLDTKKRDDGEERGDLNYVVAPPSLHPDGVQYKWVIPLSEIIPPVNLEAAGFRRSFTSSTADSLCSESDDTNDTDATKIPTPPKPPTPLMTYVQNPGQPSVCIRSEAESVDGLILRFRPAAGTHDATLFEFVRNLRAIPGLRHAEVATAKPHIRKWWETNRSFIHGDDSWVYTWGKASSAWKRIKTVPGETMSGAVSESDTLPIPKGIAEEYGDDENVARVAKLCVVLQGRSPQSGFMLSYRILAEVTDIPVATCHQIMRAFCADGFVKLVRNGKRVGDKRIASEWKWIGR
jgi:hypothetical protein